MGGHDKLGSGADSRLEGNHLAFLDFFPVLAGHGIAEMGVRRSIAVTGEVLDAPRDAGILQSL